MTVHCCQDVRREVDRTCDRHPDRFECSDCLIEYDRRRRKYGLIVHDGGSSTIRIVHCPWCGTKLSDRPPEAESD